MKVFLSVDMEGVAGVCAREEVTKGDPDYPAAAARMTAETSAAVEGAFAAGADEVWIKDAHWTGRNIDLDALPDVAGKRVRLVRGWSGHPFGMVDGLDESFECVGFVGYHSAASDGGNPLSHTLSSRLLARVSVNGELMSEMRIFAWAASLVGVRFAFLAGDRAVCESARRIAETAIVVDTFEGHGASIVTSHPLESARRIREGMERAVRDRAGRVVPIPAELDVEIGFHHHAEARRRAYYPGASLDGPTTVRFQAADWFEVLRLLRFMTL